MKDHVDIDERIGELLRRELPVPEHREGYRERVAARMSAEASAVTRASRKRWIPGPSWLRASRVEERSGVQKRVVAPRRMSGLRIAVAASVAAILLVLAAIGSLAVVRHLGKGPFVVIITDQTTASEGALELRTDAGVPYMNRPEGSLPAVLNVYAPQSPGPWPVVVMLHEGGQGLAQMGSLATKTAQRGAVVFVPEWSRSSVGALDLTPEEVRALLTGQIGDVAAAIRFARATAAHYGGDPGNLTLFGYGGGAMQAAVEALSGASASEGALDGAGSTIPESLVLFDPDYMLADSSPPWDQILAADPGVMALQTPWAHLGRRVAFPITVIGSGDLAMVRELGDPWATDSWLAVRDPSGDIRRGLEKLGALSGDLYTQTSIEQLFVERLKADGDTVTHVRLKGFDHETLSAEDLKSVLDALVPGSE
jgi:hypothetical protein